MSLDLPNPERDLLGYNIKLPLLHVDVAYISDGRGSC